jgi:integrase
MLRTIINHAIRHLDVDLAINPAVAITHFEQVNKRDLLALGDLPVWWAAVEKIENPSHRAYFKLLLFTGLRRMDAASIKLNDIREDRVHRPCPKGGTKRAFDVAMTPQLRAIIDEAKAAQTLLHPWSEYLFPANGKTGHFCGQWHDQPLGVSPHCLRRTYASACIAAGLDLVHTKALLNHQGGGDVTLTSCRLRRRRRRRHRWLTSLQLTPPHRSAGMVARPTPIGTSPENAMTGGSRYMDQMFTSQMKRLT